MQRIVVDVAVLLAGVIGPIACQSPHGRPPTSRDAGSKPAARQETGGSRVRIDSGGDAKLPGGGGNGNAPVSGVFDEDHWAVVPEADFAPENCRMYQSRGSPSFPPLAWSSCG